MWKKKPPGEDVEVEDITVVPKVITPQQVDKVLIHNHRVLMIVTNHFYIHSLHDDTL